MSNLKPPPTVPEAFRISSPLTFAINNEPKSVYEVDSLNFLGFSLVTATSETSTERSDATPVTTTS